MSNRTEHNSDFSRKKLMLAHSISLISLERSSCWHTRSRSFLSKEAHAGTLDLALKGWINYVFFHIICNDLQLLACIQFKLFINKCMWITAAVICIFFQFATIKWKNFFEIPVKWLQLFSKWVNQCNTAEVDRITIISGYSFSTQYVLIVNSVTGGLNYYVLKAK